MKKITRSRTRRHSPSAVETILKPAARARITLLAEIDSVGLVNCELAHDLLWRSVDGVASLVVSNTMPHRLIGLQITLPDGTRKWLRP